MRRASFCLLGFMTLFGAQALEPAGFAQEEAQPPLVVRKTVSLKTSEGLITSIELVNSRSQSFSRCVLGPGREGLVVWRLRARGRPFWNAKASLRDEKGREFEWFCHLEEKNVGGVFITESFYIGPQDATRVVVSFDDATVQITLPVPPVATARPGKAAVASSALSKRERFDRAFELKEQGRCDQALPLFEENIRRYPHADDADYDYGWACYCAARSGQYAKAGEYYATMRSFYSGTVETNLPGGMIQRRNWEDRLAEVRKILASSKDPNAAKALQRIRQLDKEAGLTP